MPDSYIFPVAPFLDWVNTERMRMWRALMMMARMCGILLLVVLAAGSIAVQAADRGSPESIESTEAYVRRMAEATAMAWPALARMFETTRVFADVQLLASDGQ